MYKHLDNVLNHIFIYPENIHVMLMKCCDLCGADNQEKAKTCLRCGFEFPLAIRSDIRDEAILKKYHSLLSHNLNMWCEINQDLII